MGADLHPLIRPTVGLDGYSILTLKIYSLFHQILGGVSNLLGHI